MLGNTDSKRNSILLHPRVAASWPNVADETKQQSSDDGLGSLQYDPQAGSWNANMYIDPQEGIQAPRLWSLAKHAKDILDLPIKSQLEECAEAVARLWCISNPDLFETGFFVAPRLFATQLRLGNLGAAKLENMSVAGYVSIASWGETCPQSGHAVKCLWASDSANFGLFLVVDRNFRAPGYLELPDDSLHDMIKSLRRGYTVVALAYNGVPDQKLLNERNNNRYRDLEEDDRPKIPEDIGPILHPNAKTAASGYIVGTPKNDDNSNSDFRISASLWAGSSGGPVFLVRGKTVQLIGMVSLYSGDREGNDAALLFDWHKGKMNVAIKRAQEQNATVFCDDELPIIRKFTTKRKKPRKDVRFAPLPAPIPRERPQEVQRPPQPPPSPQRQQQQQQKQQKQQQLQQRQRQHTQSSPNVGAKKGAYYRQTKPVYKHPSRYPRTFFNDSLHYFYVLFVLLVFCVIELHPKS